PWWNPAVEQQATDRAHRIGQERNVFVYKYIVRDTVEEKILKLQAAKRELSEELISSDDGFIKQLTREDLELLFAATHSNGRE
ncbi:MAG: DEAD/DEAH box helicase, partial [Calditrichaeota bacterium]|nr:DEAD/DEAH box helicase [Calditrichota bacterium]